MNKYKKENFEQVVKNSNNISDTCRNLGLSTLYGNRQTVKKYIEKYNLDISHFKVHINNSGNFKKKDLKDILVKNSSFDTTHLKHRLYKEGIKEKICEKCGQDENWKGTKISLILDHINGINTDNRIENLRILCPNCNAGLETHGGKNNKTYYRNTYQKKYYYCDCGEQITKGSKRCKKCYDIAQRKVERPSYEQLIQDIRETNYTQTGKKYGVSDNTIRKWIKKYKIM